MRILFTGGSGFIGTHLIAHFKGQGHEIVNLSRKVGVVQGVQNVAWSGKKILPEVGNVDVIINLAGTGIADSRWSDKQKHSIQQSRIDATKACVEFIRNAPVKPKLFISSSGINYYGGDAVGEMNEQSPAGTDFMGETCLKWEEAGKDAGVRTIFLRTSVVLGSDGGPLKKMITPFKLFAGGPLGSGNQYFPWIHIRDFVSIVDWMVRTESVFGPVNMIAPQQVTNREFAKALGRALKRPAFFRLPKFMLKLIFGEMSVVLWGGVKAKTNVIPKDQFAFPDIETALKDLTQK